jgi:putative transcriptional regulator
MNAGIFICSTSLLDDSFFEGAVIYLTEYNDKGAMGFVVNKLFPRNFNELEEFKHSIPVRLHDGGPVDREHLYFLHRRPDVIPDGTLIADGIYFGGDFQKAVAAINDGSITPDADIRLFIGYCGWDHLELEGEITEGSWTIEKSGNVFN